MRVDSPDDRTDVPEECDNCGSAVLLERFYSYGPGHQVDWLCPYCSHATDKNDPIIKGVACMFNLFETRIADIIKK